MSPVLLRVQQLQDAADGPYKNVASGNVSFRQNLPWEGVLHEDETVQRGAGCCGIEGNGSWDAGCRVDLPHWYFRTDVLPLEEAVSGAGQRGRQDSSNNCRKRTNA